MRPTSRIGLFFLFIVGLNSPGFAQSGIITTYAGPGMPVNGELAIDQAIDLPTSVAPDGAGGFYVASETQNQVYRVSADGRLSLVAGDGTAGFNGDGGLATSAQLQYPYGVTVDGTGNLFIADTGNHRIRKVAATGRISTVAGNGTAGFSGDGGLATAAQLRSPCGVAVDSAGNLYIADTWNSSIRKVAPGGVISTVAGNGTYGFSGDGGPATSARLDRPRGIAVDVAGNLLIADTDNFRIRKVTPDGVISTVAGSAPGGVSGDGGPATSALLGKPCGVAVDVAGSLFIADSFNNRIFKVMPDGMISTVAGSAPWGGSVATAARQLLHNSAAHRAWQRTRRATCSSLTLATIASAK